MKKTIDGPLFAQMLIGASEALEAARQHVNELNVFPVPDGDTGTNMSQTLNAAAAALQVSPPEQAGAVAEKAAAALLRGARGNSGVILSLLMRGFAKCLKDAAVFDGMHWARGLTAGVDTAYRAVMKPAEGTMLTVSRVAAEKALVAAGIDADFASVFSVTMKAAQEALAETVNQNPVLQKAGVIDAGGKGLCVMFEGMLAVMQGGAVTRTVETVTPTVVKEAADFGAYETEDIRFGYCTELIVMRKRTKRDPLRFRALLESIGDSLVFVEDDELIKIHVHTNHPGRVIEEALNHGALCDIKIENMRLQHTEKLASAASVPTQDLGFDAASDIIPHVKAAPEKRFGVVVVCAGDGLTAVFRDLGADRIIHGGQTMNPSTEDILCAIDATPAETVFVLPNNKNIIMAAEQTVGLTDKEVVVIPTKSVPHGVAALMYFEPEGTLEENRERMLKVMEHSSSGQITYAARDSEYDGHKIAPGDHMAFWDNRMIATNADRAVVMRALCKEAGAPSFVTLFYGDTIEEIEAQEAQELWIDACPDAEVQLVYGGQPVYSFLVLVEQ